MRILALSDKEIASRYAAFCSTLSQKVVKADAELAALEGYKYKV